MTHVALVHQPYRPETGEIAAHVRTQLEQRGVETEVLSAFELDPADAGRFTLALTFGGDGTTLRTARWAAEAHVPIVPVGMGTLSFLAELHPEEVEASLDPYLAGEFWRDERAMLAVGVDGQRAIALNDVVVARGAQLRAITLDFDVHDREVTRFTADAVVVATATGSTAYALAAGGPVLAPELDNLVVVPVAGHLSALRSLVLPPTAEMSLTVVRTQPATVSADGQVDFELPVGMPVRIKLAEQKTVFARRGDPRDFYAHLTARLRRSPHGVR
ncbi:MAG: NAD(+)/NADH kinase [Chloroflexi bacterium]|nr:NAD(+)/NADH kinase [Chloroflexota bacterium]